MATVRQVMEDANRSFQYRGKPIHPLLVQEFECWVSDLNPVTIAVDVAAAYDANEYAEETHLRGDYLTARPNDGDGHYGYQRTKITGDGTHILQTRLWTSGTATFDSELWVKFQVEAAVDRDGKQYDRLLLRLVRAK